MEIVLPRTCHLCGQPSGASLVCGDCGRDLPWLPADACPGCALPTGGGVCGPCQKDPPPFDETLAAFAYDFPVGAMVQGLKYGHRLELAGYFASVLAKAVLRSHERLPDLVLPMPLHPERLAERGFNQAAEIARPLARRLGIEVDVLSLVRDVSTPPQVGLSSQVRQRNVRGAFRCQRDLTGAQVAVVDDVLTTGASLAEVARCLKARGARRVTNWVVARTP